MQYELPTELFVKILQSLELRELLRCRLVEKRLRDIIDSTPQLQYNIELAVACYTDNRNNDLPLTEKLKLLQEVQGSWKRARFSLGRSLPYEHNWSYAGNIMHHEFEFMSLDVAGEELASRRWIIDPGLPEYCFLVDSAVDPAQDVAVFLGFDEENFVLCIMRLSSATALHSESIQVPRPPMDDVRAELKTFGHLVAIIFTGVPGEELDGDPGRGYSMVVTVYDVRTGTIVTNLVSFSNGMGANARDLFAFISSTSFVLGAYGHGNYSLKIYNVDKGIAVTNPDGTLAPTHVATYEFPEVYAGCMSTGWFLDESKSSALNTSDAFQPSSRPPILAVKRVYMNPTDRADRLTCVFVVPMTVFLDEIERYKGRRLTDAEPRVLPWHTWGPSQSRCIQAPSDILISPRASLTCHGYRLLVHDPRSTMLMDFNSLDIARDLNRYGKTKLSPDAEEHEVEEGEVQIEPFPGRLVLRPTVIPCGFFTQDVVTNLPYRETVVDWIGKRPFRIIDGNPSLCIIGESGASTHNGVKITDYHVLNINA